MKTSSLRGQAIDYCLPRRPSGWIFTLILSILFLPQVLPAQQGDSLAGFDEAAAMEDIRQKGIPASDVAGYLEYKKHEYVGKQRGTWNRLIPNPPPTIQAPCTNMDFETGDLTGWSGTYGDNPGCTPTCLNFGFQAGRHTIMTGSGNDPCAPFPVVAPGGSYSVRLGNSITGGQAEQLVQTFQVTVPTFIYTYAVVFQDPGHTVLDQPFFKVEMYDSLGLPINCANITYVAGPNIPGFFPSTCPITVYRPWTSVAVDLSLYIGQNVTIRFTTADCAQGGHYGYAYIDGSCLIGQITQSNVLCTGGTTNLCAPPGFASYLWTPGNQNTQCITVNSTGNYQVTMTAQGGCPVVPLTINVQQYPSPTININSANTGCTNCTGSANTVVAGGNAPYTYTWSPGGYTTANVTNLCAGTYTAIVTTIDGCADTANTTINNPVNFLPTSTSSTPPSCNGGNNGTATVNASGGTPPYTYLWANAQTTQTATNLPAGQHSVTVTDSGGCMFTTTVTVTEPSAIVALSASQFNISCSGLCDGSADILMGGGTTPYTYSWTTGSTIPSATNLCVGTYVVTVTDANGCVGTHTFDILNPPAINIATSSIDANCGLSNGSAIASASGGVSNFTYSWNTNPVQTNDTASGLPVGFYVVTVVDGNMCSNSDTVQVFNPNAPTATITSTPVTCFNASDGVAVGNGAGGTAPLTYSWNSTPVQNTATANGLPAGNYSLTVTDALTCQVVATVTITEPPQLTLATAGFPVTCNGLCDGQAVVIPAGGTGAYSINWSPTGGTNAGANSLCPNTYTVTVSDANGCTQNDTAIVVEPTAVTATISSTSSICGSSTAQAQANPGGGVGNYTYSWSTSPVQTTQTITNLASGTYTVTVIDANGCTDTASTNIVNTPPVVATVVPDNISCNGLCDGSASVTGVTGTGPYSYNWSTGSTASSISNQCAGQPFVTVTDANGCTQTVTVTIVDPPVLTSVAAANPATVCAGQSATLTVTPGGGTGAYTYAWSAGGTTNTITVTPGVTTQYTVLVTDGEGCNTSTTVDVIVNPPPIVCLDVDLSGCEPFCTQMTNCSPTAVNCIWDFGDGNTYNGCTPPVYCYQTPGTYPVILTVTDANGCVNSSPATAYEVIVTPKPVAAFIVDQPTVSVFEPYINFLDQSTNAVSWFWDFRDGTTSTQQNPSHTFPDTGMYCVTQVVTNSDNCMDTTSFCVIIEPEFTFFIPNAFTPDGDGVNELFIGNGIGIAKHQMWIFDRWGNMIFTSGESASPQTGVPWDGRASGGKELAQQDVYVWKVALTDAFGRSYVYTGHVSLIR